MKLKHAYAAAGAAVFMSALVLGVPAPLAYHWMHDRLDPRLRVYAPQGSLWHGHASLVEFSSLRLATVEWRYCALPLLLGRFCERFSATSDAGGITGTLSTGLGATRLSGLEGSLPLAQLGPALQIPVPPLSGQLFLKFSSLRFTNTGLQAAEGMADMQNLAWPLSSPPIPMGSYRAEFHTERDSIHIVLKDTAGHVELSGTADLDPQGRYKLDVKLRPRASAQAGIVSLIQQLGRADSEGWYRLRRQGQL
jgi:general secretion pathway protein N